MRSLRNPGFLTNLRAAMDSVWVAPRRWRSNTDPERTLTILNGIRALGVRISIDDFGAGVSGLAHLRSLPVDSIKIDRAFVCNMMELDDDAALVSAIIGIATTLRKHVIAEGAETEAQRAPLLHFGCHEGQGYLFSRPVGPRDIARMVGDLDRSTICTDSHCEEGAESTGGGRISIPRDCSE